MERMLNQLIFKPIHFLNGVSMVFDLFDVCMSCFPSKSSKNPTIFMHGEFESA